MLSLQHCTGVEHAPHARHWAAALCLFPGLTAEEKVFRKGTSRLRFNSDTCHLSFKLCALLYRTNEVEIYLSIILKEITSKVPVKIQGSTYYKNGQILKDHTKCGKERKQMDFSQTDGGGHIMKPFRGNV